MNQTLTLAQLEIAISKIEMEKKQRRSPLSWFRQVAMILLRGLLVSIYIVGFLFAVAFLRINIRVSGLLFLVMYGILGVLYIGYLLFKKLGYISKEGPISNSIDEVKKIIEFIIPNPNIESFISVRSG